MRMFSGVNAVAGRAIIALGRYEATIGLFSEVFLVNTGKKPQKGVPLAPVF
jgi:hypothetical protein